jgi:hypothetical protein
MFVILIESLTASPGLCPAVVETNTIVRETISGMINDVAEGLATTPSVDVPSLAVVIEAVLRGVVLQWLADPGNVDLDTIITTAQTMVRAVLGQPQPTPVPTRGQ